MIWTNQIANFAPHYHVTSVNPRAFAIKGRSAAEGEESALFCEEVADEDCHGPDSELVGGRPSSV